MKHIIALFMFFAFSELAYAQTPTTGRAPQLQFGGLNVPNPQDVCIDDAAKALKDSGLTVSYKSVSASIASNSYVSVIITCLPSISGGSRVVVFSASTDSATAEFYRNDARARLVSLASGSGEKGFGGTAPNIGVHVPIHLGIYKTDGDAIGTAKERFSQYGLRIAPISTQYIAGTNAHVGVLVATSQFQPCGTGLGSGICPSWVSVFSSSTDFKTAEYFRNAIRGDFEPPVIVR